METVGKRVRLARKHANLTQAELGKLVGGMSQGNISDLENDRNEWATCHQRLAVSEWLVCL